jgi:hypothetical protein
MFLSTRHSNENFRLGALTRASYASLALGTTILALEQSPKKSAGSGGQVPRNVIGNWEFDPARHQKTHFQVLDMFPICEGRLEHRGVLVDPQGKR